MPGMGMDASMTTESTRAAACGIPGVRRPDVPPKRRGRNLPRRSKPRGPKLGCPRITPSAPATQIETACFNGALSRARKAFVSGAPRLIPPRTADAVVHARQRRFGGVEHLLRVLVHHRRRTRDPLAILVRRLGAVVHGGEQPGRAGRPVCSRRATGRRKQGMGALPTRWSCRVACQAFADAEISAPVSTDTESHATAPAHRRLSAPGGTEWPIRHPLRPTRCRPRR